MDTFIYSLVSVIALIVVFFLIKKIAGCMIKSVIMLIVVAVLAAIYFLYLR